MANYYLSFVECLFLRGMQNGSKFVFHALITQGSYSTWCYGNYEKSL